MKQQYFGSKPQSLVRPMFYEHSTGGPSAKRLPSQDLLPYLNRGICYRTKPKDPLASSTERRSTAFRRRIFYTVFHRRMFYRIPPQDLPPYSTAESSTPPVTAACSTVFHRRVLHRLPRQNALHRIPPANLLHRLPPRYLLYVGGGVCLLFPVELPAHFVPRRGERPSSSCRVVVACGGS